MGLFDPRPACLNCKWWEQTEPAKGVGECRRNPPTMTDDDRMAIWPKTRVIDYCGGFESQHVQQ